MGLLSPEHRRPSTQAEFAKALGVSRRYVSRILKRTFFDAPIELLAASPVTPGHGFAMRRRQEQYRQQQDEQSRREAEHWAEAWHEEEARVRQVGCRPDQGFGNEGNAYLDDDPEERAWRQEEEEVRRARAPERARRAREAASLARLAGIDRILRLLAY
jgi:transcriptional regulator with XRE-family HTH domain